MIKTIQNTTTLLLTCAILTACGSDSGGGTSTTPTTPVTPTTPTTPTAPTIMVKDGSVVDAADLQALGDAIYNDTNLSVPVGQACASCHTPAVGFDDPDNGDATSLGADSSSIGNRNSPTASYAAFIPDATTVMRAPPGGGAAVPVQVGGQFWDGRAESLEEQAKGPFLNPVEMANASKSDVIDKLKVASYAADFQALFGANVFDDVDAAYDYMADAIAAFERTDLFSPFTSKFDMVNAGSAVYTMAEDRGRVLFNGKAECGRCHHSNTGTETFSDFEFHNVGVPSNATLLTNLGTPGFVDNGLGDVTARTQDNGRFRTSSLRNIADTAPYMHNGVFSTLQEVIEFYNTRDTSFPDAPEVSQNLDQGGNIGELGLTAGEIQDLIAFLNTMTDQ